MPGASLRESTTAPGAVAEEHARPAIFPVEDARIHFGPDDQRVTVLPGLDEAVGDTQRVHESAAHRLHVERRALPETELRLQQAGRARKHHVGRGRRDYYEIDVFRGKLRGFERAPGCLEREIARLLVIGGDVPLANSGSRPDPLVGGVHQRLEVAIREHLLRKITAGPGDSRIDHAAVF
jgi:hypothetical protein